MSRMKAAVDAKALAAAAREAKSVATARTSMPILACARLSADASGLSVESTSLLDRVRRHVPGTGTPGAACVDAANLATFTSGLSGELVLEHDEAKGDLLIVHGRGELTLPTMHADDFPGLTDEKKGARRERISASLLADAVRRVGPSVSQDETRSNMAGVYLGHADGKLRTASADGHRGSVMATDVGWGEGFIVPYHALPSLLRILDECDGEVEIMPSESYTRIEAPHVMLWTRAVNEAFPPIDQVMPKGKGKVASVDRVALLESVKRLSKVAEKRSNKGVVSAGIQLDFSPGELRLSGQSPDRGSAFETLACDAGFEATIKVQSTYVAEHLAAGDGERAELRFFGTLEPFDLRFPEVPGMRVVIMPMRP